MGITLKLSFLHFFPKRNTLPMGKKYFTSNTYIHETNANANEFLLFATYFRYLST